MWDNRCVVVEAGRELCIGSDASCDVVVTPSSSRMPGLHKFASHSGVMARVSCSAKAELLLHFCASDVFVYVKGIRVVPCKQPVELLAGIPISFGELHKRTTFRFFTDGMCADVVASHMHGVPHIARGTIPRLGAHASEVLSLSSSSSRDAFRRQPQHRSERVVQFVSPSNVDDGTVERPHRCVIPPPSSSSSLSAAAAAASLSYPLNGAGDSCRLGGELEMFPTACKVPPPRHGDGKEEEDGEVEGEELPPSPHAIAPFVVEVWGQRASLHSVVGHCSPGVTDGSRSSSARVAVAAAATTTTTGEYDGALEPYVTCHGRRMLKGLRHLRFETPVRSAAASVFECVEDAYEPQEDTFLQFTEHARNSLFRHFLVLAEHAVMAMLSTPMTVKRRSPIFCCGDIHGSFADLKAIYNSVVPFHHWSLMTTPVVFLGDYVDRGPYDVEVILYLLAWHALCPENLILLRGNHEDEGVNGDVEQYGDSSFRIKCRKFFGEANGDIFWKHVNDIFANMPVMAIIDDTILACHGGIPRLRSREQEVKDGRQDAASDGLQRHCCGKTDDAEKKTRDHDTPTLAEATSDDGDDDTPSEEMLQLLIDGMLGDLDDVRFRSLMPVEEDDIRTARRRRLIRELLWNDPISSSSSFSSSSSCSTSCLRSGTGRGDAGAVDEEIDCEQEASHTGSSQYLDFDVHGFRSNIGRGGVGNVIREFNASALNAFMRRWGFSLLIRAHQQKVAGLEMGFSGRILTLFSCSNYAGDMNKAGACVIVDEEVRPVSWRRAVVTRCTAETRPVFWRVMQQAAYHSGSFSDSVCSSHDRPMMPQRVPLYVGMKSKGFG